MNLKKGATELSPKRLLKTIKKFFKKRLIFYKTYYRLVSKLENEVKGG